MLLPLTDKEREALKRPVVTGDAPDGKRPGARPEDRIPWDRVKTRYDAAREFLKVSLEDLPKDKSFVIVTFGTQAAYLDGVDRLRRATRSNVSKAKRSLDALDPTPPTSEWPNGQLRGETNLHAGMRLAFAVGTKGRGEHYVNAAGLSKGCDTIFLLSDGAPNEDDWPGLIPSSGSGSKEGQKRPTGPTSGPGMAMGSGPYGNAGGYLQSDVWRLNMYRHAEIHCIGIGRANMWLLRTLARIGLGVARQVGEEPRRRR